MQTDLLIIGGGIAGLTTAIKAAQKQPDLQITVLTKTVETESNTRYAQGGIASVWNADTDNFEKHIADTHDAGDGLCIDQIVRIVIEEGPALVREMIEWGTRFDTESSGQYDLAREGGHSENRILHYKDLTGWEIQRALVAKAKTYPNIQIKEHLFAIDLITQHYLGYYIHRVTPSIDCYGVYVLDMKTNQVTPFLARATVMATGGSGQVYKATTNPVIATGDGIAMVYRAKGRVMDMEFVQFHPTSLYNPTGDNPSFLISEAVRGFGGILKTREGDEFMHRYDPRKSLAPRDIVARAIDNEMKVRGEEYMFLDCRHLDKTAFLAHFPTIYEKCCSIGINPLTQMIPVVPACHYMCGGIMTDQHGQSSINRLYAAGECTGTGLHGANRLASNSLLEGLVFGNRIVEHLLPIIHRFDIQTDIPEWKTDGTNEPRELILMTQTIKELKEIMTNYVGIVRTNVRLKRAMDRMFILYKETEELYQNTTLSPQLCELRNLLTNSYLITRSASIRRESRGLHFNTDFPNQHPFVEQTIL